MTLHNKMTPYPGSSNNVGKASSKFVNACDYYVTVSDSTEYMGNCKENGNKKCILGQYKKYYNCEIFKLAEAIKNKK